MATAKFFDVGAEVLGYVGLVASWRRPTLEYKQRYQPVLVIMAASNTDEGAHTPAESITITDRDALIALRKAIDEALKDPTN